MQQNRLPRQLSVEQMCTRHLMQAPKGEPTGKRSCKLLFDNSLCCFYASRTGLKWVKTVMSPLFWGSPKGGIGADRLIPARMAFFGQDNVLFS
jgi:hypothetical protein